MTSNSKIPSKPVITKSITDDPIFKNLSIKRKLDEEIKKWHGSSLLYSFFQKKFFLLLRECLKSTDYQKHLELVDFMNKQKTFYDPKHTLDSLLLDEKILCCENFINAVNTFFQYYY